MARRAKKTKLDSENFTFLLISTMIGH